MRRRAGPRELRDDQVVWKLELRVSDGARTVDTCNSLKFVSVNACFNLVPSRKLWEILDRFDKEFHAAGGWENPEALFKSRMSVVELQMETKLLNTSKSFEIRCGIVRERPDRERGNSMSSTIGCIVATQQGVDEAHVAKAIAGAGKSLPLGPAVGAMDADIGETWADGETREEGGQKLTLPEALRPSFK